MKSTFTEYLVLVGIAAFIGVTIFAVWHSHRNAPPPHEYPTVPAESVIYSPPEGQPGPVITGDDWNNLVADIKDMKADIRHIRLMYD